MPQRRARARARRGRARTCRASFRAKKPLKTPKNPKTPRQGTYLSRDAARELDAFASHTALLALADRLSAAYAALIAERAALAGAATEAQGARALFSAQTLRRGEAEFDNAMHVRPTPGSA